MIFKKKVDQVLEYTLRILLSIMVLNVLWQIASRYLFNDPSVFTDELSRYLLIWVGLLGAAYASGKGMHVAIELLERNLNPKMRFIQKLVVQSLILFFAVSVLIAGGIRLVFISFQLGQTSSAMQLSLGYVYLALPLSGLLISFYAITEFINQLKSN